MQLVGQRAWVIGGGTGLGAAAAMSLAAEGAEVVVSGRRVEALERVVGEIRAAAGSATALPFDATAPEAFVAAAESIGHIDILVYSAGTNTPQRRLDSLSDQSWTTILNTNLSGAFRAMQAVLPGMRQAGRGTIILVSSWAGWRLEPVAGAAYSTTKRAMLALAETVNVEEGLNGIRATSLCPAEVDTEVLNTRPVPPSAEARARMLKAADIGDVVRFIAAAPAHMCVNEIVVSPTANRFYAPDLPR